MQLLKQICLIALHQKYESRKTSKIVHKEEFIATVHSHLIQYSNVKITEKY